MLTKISYENFQCHETYDLELEPITVIRGESSEGKSALMRGLRWLCFNQPRGKEFIRWGEKHCAVRAWFDDHEVERFRGSKNGYRLDGEEFVAINQDIPDVVVGVLQMDEVNLQRQLDSHYWLSDTPGAVGKQFNSLLDLDVVDGVVDCLKKWHREVKQQQSILQEQLENELEEQIKLQKWGALNGKLSEIESIASELTILKTEHSQLAVVLEKIREAELIDIPSLDDADDIVKELNTLKQESEDLQNMLEHLDYLEDQMEYRKADKENAQKELEAFEVCPLCEREL